MREQNHKNQSFIVDMVPSTSNYAKVIKHYKKAIQKGDFYEEPLGEDFVYPDW